VLAGALLLVMIGLVFALLAVPGYLMLVAGSNSQVARGVVLLIAVGVAASWVLNNLSFDAD
jgi:hypothetical protein